MDNSNNSSSYTNPLWFRHPKFVYVSDNYEVIYKVIGYHYTIDQYKLQSTKDYNIILVNPDTIVPIVDTEYIKHLKSIYG